MSPSARAVVSPLFTPQPTHSDARVSRRPATGSAAAAAVAPEMAERARHAAAGSAGGTEPEPHWVAAIVAATD